MKGEMPRTHTIVAGKNENVKSGSLISEIKSNVYPTLFRLLYEIGQELADCKCVNETVMPAAVLTYINSQLDEIRRKEKYVLFPYLRKNMKGGKICSHLSSFETIRARTQSIREALENLNLYLGQLPEEANPCKEKIFSGIAEFEKLFNNITGLKDRFLYGQLVKE